jgi:hypothetical protein
MDYRGFHMCLKLLERSRPLKCMVWAVIGVAFMFALGPVAVFIKTLQSLGLF